MKKFWLIGGAAAVAVAAAVVAAVMLYAENRARQAEEYRKKGEEHWLILDMVEALRYYRRAAALGNAKACFEVGIFYWNGFAGEESVELAKKFFLKAEPGLLKLAGNGDPEAQLDLVVFYQNYYINRGKCRYWSAEMMKLFLAAAGRGDREAMFQLGRIYRHGYGVESNLPEAFKWFRKAAGHGHPEATHIVGLFYVKGFGVEPDEAEGMKWLELAARRGYTGSEVLIGQCLEHKHHDLPEALKWYRRAAKHGDKLAERLLREHGVK